MHSIKFYSSSWVRLQHALDSDSTALQSIFFSISDSNKSKNLHIQPKILGLLLRLGSPFQGSKTVKGTDFEKLVIAINIWGGVTLCNASKYELWIWSPKVTTITFSFVQRVSLINLLCEKVNSKRSHIELEVTIKPH